MHCPFGRSRTPPREQKQTKQRLTSCFQNLFLPDIKFFLFATSQVQLPSLPLFLLRRDGNLRAQHLLAGRKGLPGREFPDRPACTVTHPFLRPLSNCECFISSIPMLLRLVISPRAATRCFYRTEVVSCLVFSKEYSF